MEQKEFEECMKYLDSVEVIMRADKARTLAAQGNTEDAIACAMAEGFRMGWDAHKKKEEK